ncbi:MAG: DUF3857 domain-containing protein [Bacteroidota bacterium]
MRETLLFTLSLIILCYTQGNSQESLAISNIPEGLLKNVNSVVRYSDSYFEVQSIGKGIHKRKLAITILNSKARDEAEFYLSYSKLRTLRNISATVYDDLGTPMKKLKKSEIRDYSSYDGFSVYSDSRLKYIDLRSNSYPYTVEIAFEYVFDGLMTIPGWHPQSPGKYSVQKASLNVITPSDYKLRYKTHNVNDPKISSESGSRSYSWKVENLLPTKKEAQTADPYNGSISVLLAPTDFEIEGFKGSLTSWGKFGEVRQLINAGRDELSEDQLVEIKALLAGISDEKEKIKVVYEYLQKNTRYVSIQLGLGGWQTFPASYVADNGYGDCKALSNYTKTLLKEIGISSYYTLVRAGKAEDPIDKDFPSNQFNHVILCVPVASDTVWLECTSQTNPFGYLGYFTSDRDVLVLNENGGEIAHTPAYQGDENAYVTKGKVTIDKEGNGKLTLESEFNGLSYEYVDNYSQLDEKDKMKLIRSMFPVNNLELNNVEFSEKRTQIPSAMLKVDFNARKVAKVSGKRVFLTPNQINRTEYIPSKVENRTSDFKVRYERNVIDSITFELPPGIHIEYLPKEKHIESEFGRYEVSYEKGDGYLKYFRKLSTKKGVFDKKLYEDYVKFNEDCVKADKQKVVFVKST